MKRSADDDASSNDAGDDVVALASPTVTHQFMLCDVTRGIHTLRTWPLEPRRVSLIVTSPPYYGCRDYEKPGENRLSTHTTSLIATAQLGHESSPYLYARRLAATFANASSFMAPAASLFVVLGDTFARRNYIDPSGQHLPIIRKSETIGIFGIFVVEMRLLGWMLWQEIVWSKPSVPPSGAARIRFNPSSERILWFVLGKPYFDGAAVREVGKTKAGTSMPPVGGKKYADGANKRIVSDGKRCRRDVWEMCPSRNKSAHVAPFPDELVRTAILACTREGDLVLDPFAGTLTTQRVAAELRRHSLCFDIIDHTKQCDGGAVPHADTSEEASTDADE